MSPYVSRKQQAYFNAQRGKEVPASVVDEFNEASRGKKLPKKVKKTNGKFIIEKGKEKDIKLQDPNELGYLPYFRPHLSKTITHITKTTTTTLPRLGKPWILQNRQSGEGKGKQGVKEAPMILSSKGTQSVSSEKNAKDIRNCLSTNGVHYEEKNVFKNGRMQYKFTWKPSDLK